MAEQTFRSPGFFEQEIDLSQREKAPVGTPAGIIGTSQKGPAFVPVIVGSFADFETRFGTLDSNRFGPYAVREYLKNKDAITYLRVLGAGSNDTSSEISNTQNYGIVSKAGFVVSGSRVVGSTGAGSGDQRHRGCVQFLCARHYLSASEGSVGYPIFDDNDSFPGLSSVSTRGTINVINLVRGMIIPASGTRVMLANWDESIGGSSYSPPTEDIATRNDNPTAEAYNTFKIIISSSAGTGFANDDAVAGFRIYSASLDPNNDNYISKVLNTDPWKFGEEQHILWADFPVENELAPVSEGAGAIGILSGTNATNGIGLSENWRDSFGRFDTRYTAPRTPSLISQPFGGTEYDLFHFESLSDGSYANSKHKVSIANLRASTDENYPYGTFEVQLRKFDDNDLSKEVIEVYPECTLDPKSDRFIGLQIGDKKVFYDFDSEDPEERRLVVEGKYPNRSPNIRVVVNNAVYNGEVPKASLPFGFRGIPVLKTTDTFTDIPSSTITGWEGGWGSTGTRVCGVLNRDTASGLSGSILPPLPYRFKCTRGQVDSSPAFAGDPGKNERADSRLYWGTMPTRLPLTASVTHATYDANIGSLTNNLVKGYTTFQGIVKLDNLVTGSGADAFNNNKFTLARVALYNTETNLSKITGSANEHMLDAAYIRNGIYSSTDYTLSDGVRSGRLTLATLINSSSIKFNRFQDYAKFTLPFYGGFDGLNVLNKANALMNDRAASTDPKGLAGDDPPGGGLGLGGTAGNGSMSGLGRQNNVVFSYRKAVEIMTDPMIVNTYLLAVPGIRDPFITDLAADRTRDYSMAMYVMDIQQYDEDENRLFDSDTAKRDVRETAEQFEGRRVNNNYAATYFPDVYIDDPVNNKSVLVPSSVVAMGALGYNDTVAYPWFAPAGFNRGSLDNVRNTAVRLTAGDRDELYDARVNPIANFPNGGFVIFGQKTLQINKSALDRVNVRRMLLEVKRLVVQVADRLLFEPNTPATRSRFISQVAPILALVQSQAGIEKFSVVMDDTNNSPQDVEQNKLNGRIVVVPTRSVEFIAIDFIITNSGVLFM